MNFLFRPFESAKNLCRLGALRTSLVNHWPTAELAKKTEIDFERSHHPQIRPTNTQN